VSRRAEIQMTPEEVAAFLADGRTLIVATIGRDGWPHLMPMWYVLRAGEIWGWTYAKSQKVRNLERDPRCTVEVEAGREYSELRGVMLKTECTIHRDLDTVAGVGEELTRRYGGGGALTDEQREAMRRQAAKRVALQFHVRETATWDHRKLGGAY
jgi:PPOX class probable F420-dependent enzyme